MKKPKKIKIVEDDHGEYIIYLLTPSFWNPSKEEKILTTRKISTLVDVVSFYGLLYITTPQKTLHENIIDALDKAYKDKI